MKGKRVELIIIDEVTPLADYSKLELLAAGLGMAAALGHTLPHDLFDSYALKCAPAETFRGDPETGKKKAQWKTDRKLSNKWGRK